MKKQILVLIIIGLILSVSLISATENISNKENVGVEDISFWQKIINWFKEILKNEENPHIKMCLDEINHRIEVAEEKAFVKTNLLIKEYKNFNNTPDALEYLEWWGYKRTDFPSLYKNEQTYKKVWVEGYPEDNWFWNETFYEYENIFVALIKSKMSFGGWSGGPMYPVICIDGKLTGRANWVFGNY